MKLHDNYQNQNLDGHIAVFSNNWTHEHKWSDSLFPTLKDLIEQADIS